MTSVHVLLNLLNKVVEKRLNVRFAKQFMAFMTNLIIQSMNVSLL